MKKLNLGCGTDIKEGYINLDIAKLPGVDVIWNVNKFPFPFKNNEFDEVLCMDILEHVDDLTKTLKELHKIMKRGGVLKIRSPHFTSRNLYVDPTHKRGFSIETFNFYIKNHYRDYYFDFSFSSIKKSTITFRKKFLFVQPFFNISKSMKKLYEESFLRSIFPALNIEIELIK